MSTGIRAGASDNALQVNGNDVIKYDTTGIKSGYSNFSIGRNLIVNGSCQVDQVNSGALITPVNGSYPIDNGQYGTNIASKLQARQITTALNSLGVSHSIEYSVLASYSPGVNDRFTHWFYAEGLNIAHLQWGTANAASVSLQFKARASVAGTYSGAIQNGANNRSYPFTFTLLANTDTQIKIENIPGDTTGTWPTTNVTALSVAFDLGCGTNKKNTANAWVTGDYEGVTGATNLVSQVNGSTLDITDVQLEKGSYCTTFERKLYDQVLRECQRYACSTFPQGTAWGQNAGAPGSLVVGSTASAYGTQLHWRFPVPMRATPTITTYNPSAANANARNQAATADRTYSINPFSNTSTSSFTGVADATGDVTGQSIAIHFSASSRL